MQPHRKMQGLFHSTLHIFMRVRVKLVERRLCEQTGQTRLHLMDECQQQPHHTLSFSFLPCALYSPKPIPPSLQFPIPSHLAPLPQFQYNQMPLSAIDISLPQCQFLGNCTGTTAITTNCQLNAYEQAHAITINHTQNISVDILITSLWITGLNFMAVLLFGVCTELKMSG